MYHLAAYSTLLGVGTDIDVPALSDDILTIQNNHFVLNQPMGLMAAMAYSPLLDRCKLASPTMRQLAPPYLRPVGQGLVGVTNPNIALYDYSPYMIPAFEEMQALLTSAIASLTERALLAIWLQANPQPIPPGGWTPLRFTSTGTAVANAWTTVPVVFQDTIPAGVYAAVVTEHTSSNAQLHRWLFSNQVLRPGFPSFSSVASRHPYAICKGQFGVMGQFRSNDLPRLQVLCNAADAVHTGYMSVVKIGALN